MGRPPRNSQGGYVYHVIGRSLKPKPMFRSEDDYREFITALCQAIERFEPRLFGYCLLPKHWHLVLTPRKDGDLSKFMAWLTTTHSARWHTKPRRSGTGGLYERRFRSFPVQDEQALLDILRFVESHPLRAGLSKSPIEWQWCSSTSRANSVDGEIPPLSKPPLPIPSDWHKQLKLEIEQQTMLRILNCIKRSCPFGDPKWAEKTATKLGIESTLRPHGRPKKASAKE